MSLTYNQEAALEAGASNYITESGNYIGKFAESKAVIAGSGTKGIEFVFEDTSGQRANFLTVYYEKADGSQAGYGFKLLQAIMGVTKTTNVETGDEFTGKPIGLSLQKVLYTKSDGSDGYKFEIKMPFVGSTKQTLKEAISQQSAQVFNRIIPKDRDDRGQNQGQPAQGYPDMPPAGTQSDYNWQL